MWADDRHLTGEEREGVELLLLDPMILDWLRLGESETDRANFGIRPGEDRQPRRP
jgi:hypothetical protein